MRFQEIYERRKAKLLVDPEICAENRTVFSEFFQFEEYKLKRSNRLAALDDGCYKTLVKYVGMLRNANSWFANKPWKGLTKEDIRRVYDGLEEGEILGKHGRPVGDKASYYNKIFKSKPFRLVGKAELAREVIEFYADVSEEDREVRYVDEASFRKLVSVVSKPQHLLLLWLSWDIGENINALLQLTKRDFLKRQNRYTNETEYLVNLPKRKLKRSRRTRSEPTLYVETVQFADVVLAPLGLDDPVFPFEHRYALKIIHRAGERSGARALPNHTRISWKDLRSGMACHLLTVMGFSREEVDARLGHTPNSKALAKYLNYFAIDREKPKQRVYQTNLAEVKHDLEQAKRKLQIQDQRIRQLTEEATLFRGELENTRRAVSVVLQKLSQLSQAAQR